MSEPSKISRKVQSLKNVDFIGVNGGPTANGGYLAPTAYRAVPNGQTTKVRRNRTQAETLAQIERMYKLYGGNRANQVARIYGRVVNAMTAKNRWGNL